MVRSIENHNSLLSEVLGAIAHFVGRQKVVAQAMQDLDIDLDDVGRWGAAVWSQQGIQEPLSPLPDMSSDEARELWRAVQRARTRRPVAQHGTWGDSGVWVYYLHGKGCRLHNTLTGEVIDWDCPNVEAFNPYFFINHLRWRLETEDKSSLSSIRDWVSQSPDGLESIIRLVEQMKETGLVNPDWTLPKAS